MTVEGLNRLEKKWPTYKLKTGGTIDVQSTKDGRACGIIYFRKDTSAVGSVPLVELIGYGDQDE